MKVLIDMNLSPLWVDTFKAHNIESIHWSAVGDPAASDQTLMTWAKHNRHIIFTNDLDFGTLLAATQASRPSVVQVRTQDLLPENLAPTLIPVFQRFEADLDAGALITVETARSRIRILPLQTSS